MPGAATLRTSDHIALITQTNLPRDVQDTKCADGVNGLPRADVGIRGVRAH